MPYLGRLGDDAHEQGLPVMRPMVLEFPDDPGAATVDTQYMLGENLLVAPVFSADGDVDVYVPEGVWTSLLTGRAGHRTALGARARTASTRCRCTCGRTRCCRSGARTDRPDYDWADGVTLRLFELADGHRSVVVPASDGGEPTTFVVTRPGDEVRVEPRGTHAGRGASQVGRRPAPRGRGRSTPR